ncbi:MAG: hypothetical protein WCT14_13300 [Treponemataceae bacterium]
MNRRDAATTTRIAAVLLASALGAISVSAETVTTTEVSAFVNAIRSSSDTEATVYTLSKAKLTFSSRGANETKGQVTLDFKAGGDAVALTLQKAWMKARLDAVRLTLGKTRLSWGEGVLFNAGNVIFGSTAVDLSAEDLRDDNTWLTAVTLPFGDFSFLEAVALPPDLPLSAIIAKSMNPAAPTPVFGGWENCSAGGRFYAKLGEVKAEAGYLWAGESATNTVAAHKPYLSLQGNLLADWHLSTSARVVPSSSASTNPEVKDWAVSAGLYNQWSIPSLGSEGSGDASIGTLAFRLEASLRPYESWEARKIASAAVSPAAFLSGGTSLDSPYALLVYPELSWKTNTVYAFLRAIVSPIDLSSQTALAVQWAPLQGFKLVGSVSVQSGEEGDLFGWSRSGAWQAVIGTKLSF